MKTTLGDMFNVLRVARADFEELGVPAEEALEVTDLEMEQIAEMMSDGLMPEFYNCLEEAYRYIKDQRKLSKKIPL